MRRDDGREEGLIDSSQQFVAQVDDRVVGYPSRWRSVCSDGRNIVVTEIDGG